VKKIRVAQVIYGLKTGGAEKIVFSLAARIPRERFETVVITFTPGGSLEGRMIEAGVRIVRVPKLGRYDLSVLPRLAMALRREGIEIAHTHLFSADLWGRTAAAMARTPLVVSSLHSVDRWMSPAQIKLEGWTARFARRLIAVSESVKRFYVSGVGIPARKISVVYNGVDVSRLPASVGREKKRRELGVSARGLLVGTAARLEQEKDLFTWLRAARIAAEKAPGLEFVIAGDGSLREALKDYSRGMGMEKRVRFLGERLDAEKIIAVCDLVMFSSKFEGVSLAMLESMVCGKAVIASRVEGIEEVIRDGQDGVLVPPGDERGFAAALLELAGDENRRRRIGEAARKTVAERFSLERMLEGIVRIYDEELAKARSGS